MFEVEGLGAAQLRELIAVWATGQQRAAVDPAADVVDLAAAMDLLAGVHRARLAELDRSGQPTDRGVSVSTAAWLEANTGASPGIARRQVHTARILDQVLPRTGELLRAGQISTDRVDALCLAAGSSEATRQAAAADEQALLDIVRPVPMRALREVLAHWQHTVDPAGGEDDEQRQYDRRHLWISRTFENSWAINGTLDPVGGAAVKAAIDALSAPAAADDDRRPAVRHADALVQLARQALDGRQVPDVAGERPHITVTMDIRTLTGRSTEPAQLEHVGAISGRLARQIVCDAGIVRVITAGPSDILDVGRRTRTVGPALRRALNVRDRGCVFPGCSRPTSWTTAHRSPTNKPTPPP